MGQSYKEKYEQAIEKLRNFYRDYDTVSCLIDVKDELANLFPELKEGEDEKIRKEIITYFQCQSEEEPTRKEIHDKWIAWLEKQGDYANFRDKAQVGDRITKNEDGVLVNLSQLKRVAKPADSYCQDCTNRKGCINCENGELRETEQKPAEQQMYWTEEEIEPIISDYLCGREHYGGMIGRLCHLKPKQKQTEWGEDDEVFLDDILCKLEHDLVLNKDEKDWLKSLRPQNHWKPTDEQMGCLSDAIEHYNSLGYPAPKLKELLDDLKKLKSEV